MKPKLKEKIKFIITVSFLLAFFSFKGAVAFAQVIVNDDVAILNEEDSVTIDVLNNDYGLSGGIESVSIVSNAENGVTELLDDNTILYIPDQSFNGEDEFVYEVCNTEGYCGEGTVSVTVNSVDFTPTLNNDSISYIHNTTDYTFDILSNDELHDYPITVEIEQDFQHGSSYLDVDNNLVPSFDLTFVGEDSLKYVVYDNDGDSDEAWVYANVQYEGDAFYIPNSFTPNGDGYNDYFMVPDFSDYSGINLKVFNEWGQLVYKIDNYQNDWDGTGNTGPFAGKNVDEGTYYYVFKLQGGGVFSGYIFIMR